MNRLPFKGFAAGLMLLAILGGARTATAQDPSEFLGRLDANGNGMIDPSEVEGRFGFFLQRMAENNPRLDFSRPVPISRLSEEFSRMREERMRSGGGPPFGGPGGGPGGGPPGGGFQGRGGPPGGGFQGRGGPPGGGPPGRGGEDRGGDRGGRGEDQNNPYRNTNTSVEPLVPGFGEEDVMTPPPGFGAEAELFTVEVTEQDRQEAQRAFGYYDNDRNGKIDREEMSRSRYGADLPMYDKNRDGVITMNEMEYRYARRRAENSRSGGAAGPQQAQQGGDRGNRGNRGQADAGRGGGGGGESGGTSDKDRRRFADRNSYRIVPPLERLPAGLPDWFARNDADGDGQIMMSEFSSSWTQSVLAEFNQFDLNQDGLITPQECLKAQVIGADRGSTISVASAAPAESPSTSDSSDASDASSSSDASDQSDSAATSGSAAVSASPASSGPAPAIDARYLSYYKGLIGKYDANGDGALGPEEWVNMSKNPEAADTDGNKRITVEEYARWSMQR